MTFSYKMNVCQALCMVISYISGGIDFKGSRQNLEKEKNPASQKTQEKRSGEPIKLISFT